MNAQLEILSGEMVYQWDDELMGFFPAIPVVAAGAAAVGKFAFDIFSKNKANNAAIDLQKAQAKYQNELLKMQEETRAKNQQLYLIGGIALASVLVITVATKKRR